MMKGLLLKAKRIYLYSPVRPFFRRVGVEPMLQAAFRSLMYRASNEREILTIGGVSAEFDVTHPDDARLISRDIERPVIEDLLDNLNSDDVLFDVGSHIGTYACLAAQEISSSQVFAFEPSPSNIERLQENLELNDFDVRVFPAALSDSNGQTAFVEANDSMKSSTATGSISSGETTSSDEISVYMRRGDDLIREEQIPSPSVIKLDVEGAEVGVFRGLRETLSRDDCRLIYCEVHPEAIRTFGDDQEELFSILEGCGFDVEKFHDAYNGRYFIRATK